MTNNRKAVTVVIAVVAVTLALVLLGLILTGYYVTWGPFGKLANVRFGKMKGNDLKYSVQNVQPLASSPLAGKNICYLGSSVTYGSASLQESFVEFIAKRNGTTFVKEAVSGTTLVTNGAGGASYVSRMKNLNKNAKFDLFVCQLSTNDASQNKPVGTPNDTNTETVCGAINAIVDYVKDTWNCPVVFFTNAHYESESYSAMVKALQEIATTKDVGVIDLYNDAEFNDITDEQRNLFMADKIHPTKAGYLLWWTPKMEQYLYLYVR
ncbi:MAG: SGNH/GDSL hydrolase family protein [Candidatus Fimimonas sp.]